MFNVSVSTLEHPEANGAMIEDPCVENCTCWAILNMPELKNVYTWDGTKYQSCMFNDGKSF